MLINSTVTKYSIHVKNTAHTPNKNGEKNKFVAGDGDEYDKNEKSLNFQVFTIIVKIIAVTLVVCNLSAERENLR